MPKFDWGKAGRGALEGAPGGLVGAVVEGYRRGTGAKPWYEEDPTAKLGLAPKPYQFDPQAFQIPGTQKWQQQIGGEIGATRGIAPDEAFREYQLRLAADLERRARGEGPSIAEMQLQRGTERNLAAALAQQTSARGGVSPALQQRQLGMQRGQIGQEMAGQAAQARLLEAQGAQQQLAGLVGGARGQDIGTAQFELQRQSMISQFMQMGMGLDQAQAMANMRLEELRAQQQMFAETGRTQAQGQLIGGFLDFAGSAGAALI